jgi:hypothetical protein
MSHLIKPSLMRMFVSCKDLVNVDLISLTGSVGELLVQESSHGAWNSSWRTRVIWNDLNPEYPETFEFTFYIEDQKRLQLKVYNVDKEGQDLRTATLIGSSEFSVSEVVTVPHMTLTKPLMHTDYKDRRGSLTVRLEEVIDRNEKLTFTMAAAGLPDNRYFCSGLLTFRTFFRLSRAMGDGHFQVVYDSEFQQSGDPTWLETNLSLSVLCNSDYYCPLRIEVFTESPCGLFAHNLIGSVEVNLSTILDLGPAFLHLRGQQQHSGSLVLQNVSVIKEPTFIDYLSGGCELGLIVAIDFTGSNGNPRQSTSLHYTGTEALNQYEQALKAVAEVLIEYDHDHRVPVYGFGAVTYQFGLSHCFPLNGHLHNPEVEGVEEILGVYRHALKHLQMSGPTNFAQVLGAAVARAEAALHQPGLKYYVLLILTDGIISDLQATIDMIVHASRLPLSVVIIGIGNADFTGMNVLDGDNAQLVSSTGTPMQRDIVQFVAFNEVKHSIGLIRREVLGELPGSLVEYFMSVGQRPRLDLSKVAYY